MFKMVSKTTVVTMYFNIKDLPDTNESVRPKSFYMEKGRATLSLNAPMIIFCDDTCYEDIKTIRNAAIPYADAITTYVIKPIAEYDFYKHSFPIIQKNRIGNEIYNNNRNTSSYFVLCMFKILGLFLAKQLNPYKTPFYMWIDFGGSHIMRSFSEYAPQIINNPHPKISFCYIHYRDKEDLSSVHTRFNLGYCGVAAGAITAEAEYIDQFYNGAMSIFHEMLLHKMGHGEEQVIAYFHYRYPELCTIYNGDYYSILTNYHGIRDDYSTIKRCFIIQALVKERRDIALVARDAVLNSVKNSILTLEDSEIAWLSSIG